MAANPALVPFLGLFNLGPIGLPELLVIFGLVLLVFGPRKLPEIAEAFGKSINKFKSATKSASDEVQKELDEARRAIEDDDPPADGAADRRPSGTGSKAGPPPGAGS